MTHIQRALADLLRKMPDAGNQTVARVALKEHPKLFRSLEYARTAVRFLRGAHGNRDRKNCTVKEFYQPLKTPGSSFQCLPVAKEQFDSWAAVEFSGPLRCLILPDIHIPYYDRDATAIALKYGRDRKANFILLNGDLLDCYSISRWETDPRERDFPGELRTVHDFLHVLKSGFPRARIVFKEGNHEERYERYMMVRAPELLGIPEFSLTNAMHLGQYGVEHVGEMRPIRLGKLNILHGHEYKFSISNPVNPARGFFLRAKTNVLGSHLHQTSQHSDKNLEEKVVSAYSTGCLCDLHPRYRPINNWNHGFAFVEVDTSGAWHCDNLKVLHGRVY